MRGLGISRLTDITRMDRLGLPVWVSVRPRSQTLRVNAGKGLNAHDAQVGALMEAIEFAAAEPRHSQWHTEALTIGRLVGLWDGKFGWPDLAPTIGIRTSMRTRLDAIHCEELVEGGTMPVPAELVFVPWQVRKGTRPIFGTSTNGLASGNTLDEATLHGLLEVMERDAISMSLARDVSRWVDPDECPAMVRAYAREWRKLGVDLAVRQVPNCFGLPCFKACLHEKYDNHVNLAAGHGLHLSRDIALVRAVCEAAQSRLSTIHGGRDDIVGYYQKFKTSNRSGRLDADAAAVAHWFDTARVATYAQVPDCLPRHTSVTSLLKGLLQALHRLGFRTVLRHQFVRELGGLHVVRVLVPGLEHAHAHGNRMGPRLFQQVMGHAHG